MTAGTPGRSFDETASTYAATRPGYPDEALAWLLPATARRVLDLGAGTGKLTRQLVQRGLDVVAVEPSTQMGAELTTELPGVDFRPGSAEAIPLPDADVDVELVGSAFHWFDHAPALREIARVLRPGGGLGLARNIPDERAPWVAAVGKLTGARDRRARRRPVPDDPTGFTAVETHDVDFATRVTRPSLLALLQTFSYYLVLGPVDRKRLLDTAGQLADTHPDTAGRAAFDLPYVTRCWRATLG